MRSGCSICFMQVVNGWNIRIKQQVESQGSAFFFKQWGTWGSDGIKRNKHANGKMLQGEIIQQMPNKVAHLI